MNQPKNPGPAGRYYATIVDVTVREPLVRVYWSVGDWVWVESFNLAANHHTMFKLREFCVRLSLSTGSDTVVLDTVALVGRHAWVEILWSKDRSYYDIHLVEPTELEQLSVAGEGT